MRSPYLPKNNLGGLPYKIVMLLDCYIIEEADGGATFIKNRFTEDTKLGPEDYVEWKSYVQHIHQLQDELIDGNKKALTEANKRGIEIHPRIKQAKLD